MCGICGYVGKQNIDTHVLREMNDTMSHRGPDDRGEEFYALSDGYYAGMAHRRLSIFDLSKRGHQPMRSTNERVTIVYNGEIYDWQTLRDELNHYPFRSETDTETVLAAYLKWGEDFVSHLHGMFALAILDRETDTLLLARDRAGKKPLYYYLDNGEIVFASELKPLLLYPGMKAEIREDLIARYLFQQYINAPDTILKNVYKLEPGCILKFRAGELTVRRYWDLKEVYHREHARPVKDYEEAKTGLSSRLRSAVRKRMRADVPLGVFLSGGYDSSLMTAYAAMQSSMPVRTYTIGFDDPRYNEAPFAREVAKRLSTQHTEMVISESEMRELVQGMPYYFDEPFADSSQIPTMLVSALAKEDVTVALSGDGGDELFCGYRIYQRLKEAQMLEPFARTAYAISGRKGSRHYPNKVRYLVRNRNPETQSQLSSDLYPAWARRMALYEHQVSVKYDNERSYEEKDWQIRRMLLDMETYLPGDILCKTDRASMKYSLEARCPLLDTEVMEYAFSLPQSFKYHRGVKKRILRDLTHEVLPKSMMERPKKGFAVPLSDWLRGPLKEQLLSYTDGPFLRSQGLFDAQAVQRLTRYFIENGDNGENTGENFSSLLWSFFVFQQWYDMFIKRGRNAWRR